ncbi:MAG TPA: hypothetical protein VLB83_01520 [Candidatus Paceibacterota bacterium]|nr:hypothetical protein [Candidatus Paceibacterota bacterium]
MLNIRRVIVAAVLSAPLQVFACGGIGLPDLFYESMVISRFFAFIQFLFPMLYLVVPVVAYAFWRHAHKDIVGFSRTKRVLLTTIIVWSVMAFGSYVVSSGCESVGAPDFPQSTSTNIEMI